ncbi:helix-turn-helix transcriptional regulator [Bacillus mobilis]|uniref:helix-turn-helix domain-containing protein n=1 Tax=Bacillus mobilis TaxID=2026190 RepID=UPI002E204974|nr:helix-turn-helix transcriptional regulator [Bacillus mobilis]
MLLLKEKIKTLRKKRKMTQKAFGELMGVSESFISKVESGDKEPSKDSLFMLCSKINVPISYFFEGEDNTDVFNLFNQIKEVIHATEKPLFKGKELNHKATDGLLDGIDFLIRQTERMNENK